MQSCDTVQIEMNIIFISGTFYYAVRSTTKMCGVSASKLCIHNKSVYLNPNHIKLSDY
jgi:hypothetical protein